MINEIYDGVFHLETDLNQETKDRINFLKQAIKAIDEAIIKNATTGVMEEEIRTQYGGRRMLFSSPTQLHEAKKEFQKELNYLIQNPMEIVARLD